MLYSNLFAVLLLFTGSWLAEANDDDDIKAAIEAGKARWTKLSQSSQTTDTHVSCNFDGYSQKVFVNEKTPEDIEAIMKAAQIVTDASWTTVETEWPKQPEDGYKPDPITASFKCSYNPSGTIICENNNRFPNDNSPYSAADVAWTVYKRVVDRAQITQPGKGQYTNLKHLVHADIISEWSPAVFKKYGSEKVTSFEPGSEAFLAFLGLNNGRAVTSLLTYHNEEMGGKKIHSVEAWVYTPEDGWGQSLRMLMWILK